jgi:hypothetical protein
VSADPDDWTRPVLRPVRRGDPQQKPPAARDFCCLILRHRLFSQKQLAPAKSVLFIAARLALRYWVELPTGAAAWAAGTFRRPALVGDAVTRPEEPPEGGTVMEKLLRKGRSAARNKAATHPEMLSMSGMLEEAMAPVTETTVEVAGIPVAVPNQLAWTATAQSVTAHVLEVLGLFAMDLHCLSDSLDALRTGATKRWGLVPLAEAVQASAERLLEALGRLDETGRKRTGHERGRKSLMRTLRPVVAAASQFQLQAETLFMEFVSLLERGWLHDRREPIPMCVIEVRWAALAVDAATQMAFAALAFASLRRATRSAATSASSGRRQVRRSDRTPAPDASASPTATSRAAG